MSNDGSPQGSSQAFGWRPDLMLGIAPMDYQHRQLVASAAELHFVVTTKASQHDVVKATRDLIEITRQHFDWEEQLMLNERYDGYAAHKEHHDRLLKQLVEVESELEAGSIGSCQTLALFIETWTLQHLLIVDKALALFLEKSRMKV